MSSSAIKRANNPLLRLCIARLTSLKMMNCSPRRRIWPTCRGLLAPWIRRLTKLTSTRSCGLLRVRPTASSWGKIGAAQTSRAGSNSCPTKWQSWQERLGALTSNSSRTSRIRIWTSKMSDSSLCQASKLRQIIEISILSDRSCMGKQTTRSCRR